MPLIAFANALLKMIESPRIILNMQELYDGACFLFACRMLFPSIFGTSSVREKWEWLNKSRVRNTTMVTVTNTNNNNTTIYEMPELINVITTIRILIDGCVSLYKHALKTECNIKQNTKSSSSSTSLSSSSSVLSIYIEDVVLQMNNIVEQLLQGKKTTRSLSSDSQRLLFQKHLSTILTLLEMICDIILVCILHMKQYQDIFISSISSIRSD